MNESAAWEMLEMRNVNAVGSAVGVDGPFMVILLLGNNMSQLLCNLPERRARSLLHFLCSDKITSNLENNARVGVWNPESRNDL